MGVEDRDRVERQVRTEGLGRKRQSREMRGDGRIGKEETEQRDERGRKDWEGRDRAER